MIDVILQEIASILLFFYAIGRFSKMIMHINASTLKSFMQKITHTPVRSILFGTFTTALIQSQKAVSSIALSLVNAGALTAMSCVPIILATTIGASSTAFLVSLKWASMEECLIIAGAILKKIKKCFNIGNAIFYLGLILFALELMMGATSVLKENETFLQIFLFTKNPIILFFVGCILTCLFQSPALVISIVTILVSCDILNLQCAMYVATGVTVGASISLFLIVLGMNKEAKMAYYINTILISLCGFGSLLATSLFVIIGSSFNDKAVGFAVANAISRITIALLSVMIFLIVSYLEKSKTLKEQTTENNNV
ncbi:MAG: Na/Pi cotransporter family protein [Rickettsiales bacterium]|nr:Na/Pi cotransporter family protein [Rickettsiales bacterium]